MVTGRVLRDLGALTGLRTEGIGSRLSDEGRSRGQEPCVMPTNSQSQVGECELFAGVDRSRTGHRVRAGSAREATVSGPRCQHLGMRTLRVCRVPFPREAVEFELGSYLPWCAVAGRVPAGDEIAQGDVPAADGLAHRCVKGEQWSDLFVHPHAQPLRAPLAFLKHDIGCEFGWQRVSMACSSYDGCRWAMLEVRADTFSQFEFAPARHDPKPPRDLDQFRAEPIPAKQRRCLSDFAGYGPLFLEIHPVIVRGTVDTGALLRRRLRTNQQLMVDLQRNLPMSPRSENGAASTTSDNLYR